jgi:hypothetical protein
MRLRQAMKLMVVAALAGTLASAASAFTAPEGAPRSGAIRYVASGVGYTLTQSNPATVDTLTFEIARAAPPDVRVRVGSGGWKACAHAAGRVVCDYRAAPVSVAAILGRLTVVPGE